MRSLILFICITAITCALTASPVLGKGIGVYGSQSMGLSYWDIESDTEDIPGSYFGGGLLIDTAMAKDRLLSYRLGIGYERTKYDSFHGSSNLDLDRIVVSNTLGFGLFRHEKVRLWLGPQFRLSFNWGNDNVRTYDFDPLLGYAQMTSEETFGFVRFDLGLALGANIHLPGNISLGIEFGPRAFLGYGEIKYSEYITTSLFPMQERGVDKLNYIYGYETFINVCILYRIRDEYRASVRAAPEDKQKKETEKPEKEQPKKESAPPEEG